MKRTLVAAVIGALLLNAPPAFSFQDQDGHISFDSLDDFHLCVRKRYDGEACLRALDSWLKQNPGNSFRAGVAVRATMNAYEAVPFFARAVAKENADCGAEDLKLAVVSALGLSPSDQKAIEAKRLAFESCFSNLKEALKEHLATETNSQGAYSKNTCADLVAKNAISGLMKRKCESK